MTAMEIVLLVCGAAIFIISFFLPSEKKKGEAVLPDSEDLKKAVDDQVRDARERIQTIVEESVRYAAERSETSMDRLSNEKMMALNEYSETVLSSIDRNHQEVLFLYDMLNEKSVDLKNTVREAQQVKKETMDAAEIGSRKDTGTAPAAAALEEPAAVTQVKAMESVPVRTEEIRVSPVQISPAASPVEKLAGAFAESDRQRREAARPKVRGAADVDLALDEGSSPGRNKNDMILKLHREGKSNVEIARELGLGMGEVKLVISLYTV